MCGICGWVGGSPEESGAQLVRAMADAIAHRGPEGDGAHPVGPDGALGWLGHRRLRILDVSEAAHQPMVGDGGHALVFNGEVYNFADLRRELAGRGHRFRSTGDTEVVLRAFEEWGTDAVSRLDGMFALAFWDPQRRTLLLARDRTGKKPLFYTVDRVGRLTFGSEVKALAVCPWIELQPDWPQLASFLTFGYVPHPATAYAGIRQVEPGTIIEFDAAAGTSRERRYWSPLPGGPGLAPDADTLAEVRELLGVAVRRRMVSDVPIGALLSGGIDSSIVTALMTTHSEDVRTFAVGFPDESSFDERRHARAVAAHLGTNHTEFAVRADAVALLDRLVWLHDGPFADSSAVPTYLVCAAARTHVTVVLTGDGGDEVFAGYQRFAAAALSRLLTAPVAAGLRSALPLLPTGGSYHDPRKRLSRFVGPSDRPLEERYLDWVRVFGRATIASLTGSDNAGEESFVRAHDEARAAGLGPIDALVHANFCTYLPGDLSVKIDRASRGSSLEARAPFLDTALVELLARVPARHKVGFSRPKPLLRRAFGDLLPAEVWRRPKHGFGVPMDRWFRGELGTLYADEVLAGSGRLATALDAGELRRLWLDHREGRADHGPRLWTLLTLERWLRDLAGRTPLREPAAAGVAVDVR